jgi:hypothetical protein
MPDAAGGEGAKPEGAVHTLPAPSPNKVLIALPPRPLQLILRMPFRPAHCSFYISQQPELYDIAPLIQHMLTELVLHNPRL